MIAVSGARGSVELIPGFRKAGMTTYKDNLKYGDFAFEGNGPKGKILIGVERKTLHDMLDCIDTNRYSEHQYEGMKRMYQSSWVLLEGCWRKHSDKDILMEGFNGGKSWGYCKYNSTGVLYSKLRRYLFSIEMARVPVLYTRDAEQTVADVIELFHYFQKNWADHTSFIEVQKFAIATLEGKPPLVHRWAYNMEGIGAKHSMEARKIFKSGYRLANSSEQDWLRIPGIGVPTARKLVREIHEEK